MGKFPVKYMGSLANGICMGGLVPVVVNIVILSMDVDIQVRAQATCARSSSYPTNVAARAFSDMGCPERVLK